MPSYLCPECIRDTDSPICEECGQPTERLDDTAEPEDELTGDPLNDALPLDAAEAESEDWNNEDKHN